MKNKLDLAGIFNKAITQGAIINAIDQSKIPDILKKAIVNAYKRKSEQEHLSSIEKSLPGLETEINELQAAIEHPDFRRSRFPKIYRNKLFFAISLRDINHTYRQLLLSKDEQEQNLLSRSLALHLYEYLKDFQELTGKLFRNQLKTIPFPDGILKEFDEMKQVYKFVHDKYLKDLADVRHNAIGHKTKDVKALINSIKKHDKIFIQEVGVSGLILYALYLQFYNQVSTHLLNYPQEIAQMSYLSDENFQ